MKSSPKGILIAFIYVAFTGAFAEAAANPQGVDPLMSHMPDETGPHYKIWKTDPGDAGPQGAQPTFAAGSNSGVGRVVEIATGMNYWDGQKWTPSDPTFEISEDAFVAERLQHKVRLKANLNAIGAVSITTPDGNRLHSTPVGIGLYDAASGKSAIIGVIRDCSGVLVDNNRVVYENAFKGVCADVVYTIDRGTFEQDVVITERLDPADWGFDPATARIRIFTEFYDTPHPERIRRPIRVEKKQAVRNRMVNPDLVDEMLDFGEFVLATGRAYTAARSLGDGGPAAPVAKEYTTIAGRTFLIEAVEYRSIQRELEPLPECDSERAANAAATEAGGSKVRYASLSLPLLDEGVRVAAKRAPTQMARAIGRKSVGLVIDYLATIGPGFSTPSVFQGDTTYLVSGAVVCSGPTTIEGGAVFKYKYLPSPSTAYIRLDGTLTCNASSYRPAIFTAVDDNSVGESMSGYANSGYTGTINPNKYANPALLIFSPAPSLGNLHFRYAQEAIRVEGITTSTVTHSQVVDCIRGIVLVGNCCSGCGPFITVHNSLIANVQYPLTMNGYSSGASLISCTVDGFLPAGGSSLLVTASAADCSASFVNSVVANMPANSSGPVSLSGNKNAFYASTPFGTSPLTLSGSSPFQAVGAGSYYLANGSPCRNYGATLPVALANDFKGKTTCPPVLLAIGSTASSPMTAQVPRDSDTPDLGYHYAALDYLCSQLNVPTIVLTNGVAVGLFGNYGFSLVEFNSLTSEGTPGAMNRLVWYPSVQEQPVLLNGISTGSKGIFYVAGATQPYVGYTKPIIKLRFTDLVGLGRRQGFFYGGAYANVLNTVSLTDCWLRGIDFFIGNYPWEFISGNPVPVFTLQNNLVERSAMNLFNGAYNYSQNNYNNPLAASIYNNLIKDSSLILQYNDLNALYHPAWAVKDNLFDNAAISFIANGSFQSFVSRSNNRFYNTPTGTQLESTPINLTALTYAASAFGPFYIASSTPTLADQGSRSASAAGLYHHTIFATNGKERSSTVDVGFHYVATEPDRQGLVAHWRLDDGSGPTVADSSGNNLNGSLSGATWTTGTLEGALNFNGSDQYVSVPNNSLLSFPSGPFSISAWVNPSDSIARIVLAKGDGGPPDWSEYILTVNSVGFWFKGAWRSSAALSGVSVGVWTHLAVTYDGSSLRFYRNGILMDSMVPTGSYASVTTFGFYLSRQGAGGYNNFAGPIDEVRIYSRALSVTEIGYLYSKGTWDYDGDGLADYFEDRNGNGSTDSGETLANNPDSDGDGVSDYIEYLQGRNPLIAGSQPDSGGNLVSLKLFTPIK